MICPKCHEDQENETECSNCGIIFAKYMKLQEKVRPDAPRPPEEIPYLERMLDGQGHLLIEQHARHWWEILFNWEQANQYLIRNATSSICGVLFEDSRGFLGALARNFLKSHRPLDVKVVHHQSNELAISFQRPFFFFFSDLDVITPDGRRMGHVRRRFGLLYKRYDLYDERGNVFAHIASPFWRLWTFPVFNSQGNQVAVISKRWGGWIKEIATDADNFLVDFGKAPWTVAQKAVLFAAAISVDFDFFENNN